MKAAAWLATGLMACVSAPEVKPAPSPEPARPGPAVAGPKVVGYGDLQMVELAPDVLVEQATTAPERERLADTASQARADLAAAMGTLQTDAPLTIFCKTESCGHYFAGTTLRSHATAAGARMPAGSSYVPKRQSIIILRIDEQARSFAVHEMVHLEVGRRLGGAFLPAWFQEGLATFLSDNLPCNGPPIRAIDDLRRLEQPRAWGEYTDFRGTTTPTYCQAKAEVAAWVRQHSREALLELVKSVAAGARFADVYGPLLTGTESNRVDAVMTTSTELGDDHRPFTLAMWIKPVAASGVLVNVSDTPVGAGYCAPLIGFDASHHLVSQVLFGNGPEPVNFATSTAPVPLPPGKWSHVAMTWVPGGVNRLFVNGVEVAQSPAPKYLAGGAGRTMYLTWGSFGLGGIDYCWLGSVARENFSGAMSGMRAFDRELTAAQLLALAKDRP